MSDEDGFTTAIRDSVRALWSQATESFQVSETAGILTETASKLEQRAHDGLAQFEQIRDAVDYAVTHGRRSFEADKHFEAMLPARSLELAAQEELAAWLRRVTGTVKGGGA